MRSAERTLWPGSPSPWSSIDRSYHAFTQGDTVVAVPYLEETPAGWSRTVQETWRLEGLRDGGVRLSGPCPTCGHASETLVTRIILSTPGTTKSVGANGPEPVLVQCDCGLEHDGRRPE